VRHGQTEWNKLGLIQGHKDSPLTELGIEETKKLAQKFKNIKFDYVFSSDLMRAKRTAEIIALEHKLAVETSEMLRERDFGHLEGQTRDHFNAWDEALQKLEEEERYSYKHSPEIESDEEIVTRLITFLRETAVRYPGKTILVVSHGGVLRAMLLKLGFASHNDLMRGAVRNNSFIKIETDGSDFQIKEVSGITLNAYVK
jgi:2,3-bisphosphoglycerate-dependent phosphoglycerate mutase